MLGVLSVDDLFSMVRSVDLSDDPLDISFRVDDERGTPWKP